MAATPAPITRGNLNRSLERGARTLYFQGYDDVVGEIWPLFTRTGSEKAYETNIVGYGLSTFTIKNEADAPDLDSGGESYTKVLTHSTYAKKIVISEEAREDELYGLVMGMPRELGRMAKYTQEIQATALLNNSSATQYTAGGTNYPLLSTTHYRQDDGTWSNKLSSGADLTPESLEALLVQARTGTLDLRGIKQQVRPKYLVVGASDEFNAKRILLSTQRSYTADNDINPIKDLDLQLLVLTHMTDDGRWYLATEPAEKASNKNCAIWFDRRPVRLDNETEGTGSGNAVFTGSYRQSSGLAGHPRGWWGSL